MAPVNVQHIGTFHRRVHEVLVGRVEGIVYLEGLGVRRQGAVDIHVVLEIACIARTASDIRVLSIQTDCVPLERTTHAIITFTVNTVGVTTVAVHGVVAGALAVYAIAGAAGEVAAPAAGGRAAHSIAGGSGSRYAGDSASHNAIPKVINTVHARCVGKSRRSYNAIRAGALSIDAVASAHKKACGRPVALAVYTIAGVAGEVAARPAG